jgi:hypothetical protein
MPAAISSANATFTEIIGFRTPPGSATAVATGALVEPSEDEHAETDVASRKRARTPCVRESIRSLSLMGSLRAMTEFGTNIVCCCRAMPRAERELRLELVSGRTTAVARTRLVDRAIRSLWERRRVASAGGARSTPRNEQMASASRLLVGSFPRRRAPHRKSHVRRLLSAGACRALGLGCSPHANAGPCALSAGPALQANGRGRANSLSTRSRCLPGARGSHGVHLHVVRRRDAARMHDPGAERVAPLVHLDAPRSCTARHIWPPAEAHAGQSIDSADAILDKGTGTRGSEVSGRRSAKFRDRSETNAR